MKRVRAAVMCSRAARCLLALARISDRATRLHLSPAAGRLLQGLNEDCQTIQQGIGDKVGMTGVWCLLRPGLSCMPLCPLPLASHALMLSCAPPTPALRPCPCLTVFNLSTAFVGIIIGGWVISAAGADGAARGDGCCCRCCRSCCGCRHCWLQAAVPRHPCACSPAAPAAARPAAFTRGWEMTLVMLAVTPVLAGMGFAISMFISKNTVRGFNQHRPAQHRPAQLNAGVGEARW